MGDVGSCSRAREWISADLDGELSEIERALLRAHVADCPVCEAHARAVAATAVQLRFAALEQPDLPSFTVARRARVSLRTVQAVAAAAAVAVAAGLGSVLGASPSAPARSPQRAQSRIVDVTDNKLVTIGPNYLKAPERSRSEPQ